MLKDISIVSYGDLLATHHLTHQIAGNYMTVGAPPETPGWVIHISCIATEFVEMMEKVLPVLKSDGLAFKIPRNFTVLDQVLSGYFGYALAGKVVTIYTSSGSEAVDVAQSLVAITENDNGPSIPSDFHVGGTVYVRYETNQGNDNAFASDATAPTVPAAGWPFTWATPTVERSLINLKGEAEYIYQDVIKEDAKGKVYRMLRKKSLFNVLPCIVKQGRKHMMSDLHKRDMRVRLKWQFDVLKKFQSKLNVPEVYEYFEQNGDGYLAMSELSGKSLDQYVGEVYTRKGFLDMARPVQLQLVNYLLSVLDTVQIIHAEGYVHRDLSLANFFVKGDDVYAIDMELAYSIEERLPDPAFGIGSPGYMSPQQLRGDTPMYEDDCYALGAALFKVLTGFNVRRLLDHSWSNISFFIPDENLAEVITACLSEEPAQRPGLGIIREAVLTFKEKLSANHIGYPTTLNDTVIHQLLESALAAMSTIPMSAEKLWYSYVSPDQLMPTEQAPLAIWPGFYYGIPGILYLLAKAKQCGFSLKPHSEHIEAAWQYLLLVSNAGTVPGNMKEGMAGVCLAIAEHLRQDALYAHESILSVISQSMDIETDDLSLPEGISGQGMVWMAATAYLPPDIAREKIARYVQKLKAAQTAGGRWGQLPAGINGVSGVVLFLLEYHKQSTDPSVLPVVEKALKWLELQFRKQGIKLVPKDGGLDYSLTHGMTGVTLIFLKAYQVLNRPTYKNSAVALLANFADYYVPTDLSLEKGLAGLGFLYCEACAVLEDDQYRQRATYLVNALYYMARREAYGTWWTLLNEQYPTAALMNGNGGIAYFLLKYLYPDRIHFPGLSF